MSGTTFGIGSPTIPLQSIPLNFGPYGTFGASTPWIASQAQQGQQPLQIVPQQLQQLQSLQHYQLQQIQQLVQILPQQIQQLQQWIQIVPYQVAALVQQVLAQSQLGASQAGLASFSAMPGPYQGMHPSTAAQLLGTQPGYVM